MKKITDPARLLPSAKSAAVKRSSKPSSALVRKGGALVKQGSAAIAKKEQKDVEYVNVRLLAIDNLFRNDFINARREAEQRRRITEEQDLTEAEKKLETPKSRKLKLGGKGDSPSLGFFDRVKRFLFFTALGWLVPKIIDLLPKLEGVVKTIGTVYKFAEGLFGNLFNGFMTLVKFGGDLKKQTLGFIATMKGGDYQTEFNKLEKTFDTFVNASIIAGVLAADIGFAAVDEYNKWNKKNKKTPKAGEPSRRTQERPRVTQGRGGRAGLGAASRVTQGRGGRAPSWWNRIFKGPFAKLKVPLAKFAGTAVPGLGAVVGAADAAARFKAGDNIGGALASVSAGLDTITAILAATGVGLPAAAVFGTVSIGIDVILLIRDIAKAVFPAIPMFNKGGRVVNRYQNGGTAKSTGTSRRAPRTPIRRPIKTKPPETKPGRDVGGEKKIKAYYSKDSGSLERPAGGWLSGLDIFSGKFEDKEKNKPFETLKRTSKILKDLPLGLGYFAGGAIDIALGQSMDVKKGLNQLSSGVAYMVDTLANQRVNMSMSALTRDLNAFAEGGFVPPNRQLRDPYAAVNSKDLIAKVLGPTIDQKVNEAIQSIEKDLRSIQQKKEEAPSAGGAGGLGGGVGPAIESIDVSGMSADDVDALGRMIAAEAAGEDDLGKAGVLATILNRYRLIKSGKASPSQFNIRGKTKDEVTIRDILFASGQFSPYANGSFARTSSSSGKSALASAIRAGGNDPEKLRENLVKSGLSEQDADYVVRSVAFSNAQERGSRPFPTREVTVGRHSFQQSPDVRLTGPIGRMDADIKEAEALRAMVTGGIKPSAIPLTSRQGWRWDRMHKGIDLDGGDGSPISSAQDATVVFAGDTGGGYGKEVVLRYSNGAEARFAHLKAISVREGETIKAGQLLGKQGNTGRSTGSHLHFEYYPNGGAMTYQGYGDALSVKDSLFRYGGNVKPIVSTKPQTPSSPPGQPPTRSSSQTINASTLSGKAAANAIRNIKPGQKIVFTGVGSVQGGKDWMGRPQTKYFDPQGNPLTEQQFTERYAASTKPKTEKAKPTQLSSRTGQLSPEGPIAPKSRGTSTAEQLRRLGIPVQGKLQGGGLIRPRGTQLPLTNSFASYENPTASPMIAIQPIIIEKPSYTTGNRAIAFPVPVALNNDKSSFLSRG